MEGLLFCSQPKLRETFAPQTLQTRIAAGHEEGKGAGPEPPADEQERRAARAAAERREPPAQRERQQARKPSPCPVNRPKELQRFHQLSLRAAVPQSRPAGTNVSPLPRAEASGRPTPSGNGCLGNGCRYTSAVSEAEGLLRCLAMAEPGGEPEQSPRLPQGGPSENSQPGGQSYQPQQLEPGATSKYQEVWPRSDQPGELGKRGSQSQAPY